MRMCPSCGGIIGQDCFNPDECAWITQDMAAKERMRVDDMEARLKALEQKQPDRFADTIQVSKDGNKWCAMIGEDLQVGIAGFGDTPSEAVVNLTKHDAFSEWSNNLH